METIHLEHIVALQWLHLTIKCGFKQFVIVVIWILGFKSPRKALGKTVKQPWKTLDFLISEDVWTLSVCFGTKTARDNTKDCFI